VSFHGLSFHGLPFHGLSFHGLSFAKTNPLTHCLPFIITCVELEHRPKPHKSPSNSAAVDADADASGSSSSTTAAAGSDASGSGSDASGSGSDASGSRSGSGSDASSNRSGNASGGNGVGGLDVNGSESGANDAAGAPARRSSLIFVGVAAVCGAALAAAFVPKRKIEVSEHPLKGSLNKRINIFTHMAQHTKDPAARPPRRVEEEGATSYVNANEAMV
jgi:hypothetical protein